MNHKKSLVYTLIFLLTFTSIVGLFSPVQATEEWTPITLPYTITAPGNYLITNSWFSDTVAVPGLIISASDVVVDGQNYLIESTQSEDEIAIKITPGCKNVLLTNINQTRSDYGLWAEEASFTVQNSRFTNNTSSAIFAYNADNFTINYSFLSNNSYGLFSMLSSNLAVTNCHFKNNTNGLMPVLSSNITVQDCYLNNNTDALLSEDCTNIRISDSKFTENADSITGINSLFSITNTSLTDNHGFAITCISSNFTATEFESKNSTIGLFAQYSNISINYATLSDNIAGILSAVCNTTVVDCALTDNLLYGALIIEGNSTTINDCSLSNNEIGVVAGACQNLILENSLISNNSFIGLEQYFSNNALITGNIFSENGLASFVDSFGGAIIVEDTNCTVTNNAFNNNYDALMLGIFDEEMNNTQSYHYNSFNNNSFTFDFNYGLSSNFTNQQIYFYNNFVNDSAYVNPESFTQEGQFAPPSTVLHLNITLQAGARPYSSGPMVGGNYWAYPNRTGPSQTGTDVNSDGFIDSPFDLFGNQTVFDYLPYSSDYETHLIYTSGASQSLVANQSSALISIQTVDYYGTINPGTTVTLSSNSTTGKFYSDAACTQIISNITIPGGSSTASFYYKDLAAGTPVLTVSAQGMVLATTTFTITPHAQAIDHIVITPDAATISADTIVNYTTTAYDIYSNAWDVSASYTVNGESFSGNSLAGGEAGVYYIQATYNDKTADTTLTVTPGAVNRFVVLTPNSATAGNPFAIRVIAIDSQGNIVTGFTGPVTLTVSGSTINPTSSGKFSQGNWIGNVTIAATGSYTINATDTSGHSGKSVTINVNDGTVTPTPIPTPTPTPTPTIVQATKEDGTKVNLQISGNITSSQITNITIGTNQASQTTAINFIVSGPTGSSGFSNITIPKNTIPYGTIPTITIDGQPAENQGYTQDNQNYYVWFNTTFSTHQIQIQFTTEENSALQTPFVWISLIVVAAAIAVATALVLVWKKRK